MSRLIIHQSSFIIPRRWQSQNHCALELVDVEPQHAARIREYLLLALSALQEDRCAEDGPNNQHGRYNQPKKPERREQHLGSFLRAKRIISWPKRIAQPLYRIWILHRIYQTLRERPVAHVCCFHDVIANPLDDDSLLLVFGER